MSLKLDLFRSLGTRANLWVRKTPLKLKEIWAIRVRLQVFASMREWRCRSWRREQAAGL
jgi:hypothetical protein